MEFILVVLMIAAGVIVAIAVMITIASLEARERQSAHVTASVTTPEQIAASLLFTIARIGGANDGAARRAIEREAPGFPPPLAEADISTWAGAYHRQVPSSARSELLERAVRIAVTLNRTLPLPQYNALLDLSFALGFQTDALARLRARYRFEYVDYAKYGRPREADRGGRQTFFARKPVDRSACLRVLGLDGAPTREEVTSAYRRLAAKHHPDRHHNADPEKQESESRRFVQVTEAYEDLLTLLERD